MLQENAIVFHDHHLAVMPPEGTAQYVPLSRLTELTVSQMAQSEGRQWVVMAEIDLTQRVRLATFAASAPNDALRRAAGWATRCFGAGHTVSPAHSRPTAETPVSVLHGACLQHVTTWGTQFVPVARVTEVQLQTVPSIHRWQVVAHIVGRAALPVVPPTDDRSRAEQLAHTWAEQIFDAQARVHA